MIVVTEAEIDSLLASTDSLLQNIFTFDCSGHTMPGSSHRGAAVAHQDTLERRSDFLRELRNTMSSWVYSKAKYKSLLDAELIERGKDVQNAVSHIQALVVDKFRKGHPHGQFGELLLFNLLQHFFKAAPILRKMPITTNPAIERHGSDAIHYRPIGGKNVVFIGESKTYASKYRFKVALDDAINSILTSFSNFSIELGRFVYEDFIEDSLRDVAAKIKRNTLPNVVYELVCVISYQENESKKSGKTQTEIEQLIEKAINENLIKYQNEYGGLDQTVLSKIHFIIFPFWELDTLLDRFDQ
jgi:hypothetical protein